MPTVINRKGNKSRIADKIIKHFPNHDCYIEPFFGAGGLFFAKPQARYNLLNDIDEDVYNLYRVIVDKKEELREALRRLIVTSTQFKAWGSGFKEETDVMQAVRFITLSNFGMYGGNSTLRIGMQNGKDKTFSNLDAVEQMLSKDGTLIHNKDFYEFMKCLIFRSEADKARSFVYCDPPYAFSGYKYGQRWGLAELNAMLDYLIAYNIRFAVSEFDNKEITGLAKSKGLNLIDIGERKNIKNRRTEILITNYEQTNQLI